jgi:hypothetical protein
MLTLAGPKVRKAQYTILEAVLPGRPTTAAGVLLLDPGDDRLHIRLREEWRELADPEDAEVLELLAEDLAAKEREKGGEHLLARLEDSLSNALRITERTTVAVGDFSRALARLFERQVLGQHGEPAEVLPFRTHLPLYSLAAAAGKWGEDMAAEPEGWLPAPEEMRLSEHMFVARVVGRSMEPLIPEDSFCIFRGGTIAGTRENKLLLIWNRATLDSGGRYTVKRYTSRKERTEEGSPLHKQVRLVPLNPEYEAWDLTPAEFDDNYRVIAEFLAVLPVELM